MKRKTLLILLCILMVLGCGAWFVMNFTIVDFHVYSRSLPVLDLLGQNLSVQRYEKLQQKLPQCLILWDVPFQGRSLPNTTQELTVQDLSDEDVMMLQYFPALTTVNADGCVDYPQLLQLQKQKPDCRVNYLVWMDGVCYPQDTTSIELQHFSSLDLEGVQWLPRLQKLRVGACDDYSLLRQLALDYPRLDLTYSVELGQTSIPFDAQQALVTGEDEQKLLNAIPALLDLKELELVNCTISDDAVETLRQMLPGLTIENRIELGGQIFKKDVTEVLLEKAELGSMDELRAALFALPELELARLVDCTINGAAIPNEDLAALRDEAREHFKLAWKLYVGRVPTMSDDTWFMPIKKGEYYFQQHHAYNLRYCEDMVCIDLGHSTIEDLDFCAFMPHLKYLIITDSQVKDIKGISNCKELVYFENDFTIIRDLSPLLGCTALEDLNLESPHYGANMSPVYQMTWLKNLFIARSPSYVIYGALEALPDTRVDYHGLGAASGQGWRNLPNYYAMRDYLGMPYMA